MYVPEVKITRQWKSTLTVEKCFHRAKFSRGTPDTRLDGEAPPKGISFFGFRYMKG